MARPAPRTELLDRFIQAFKRGIEGELAALRASTEAFEIQLGPGEDLGNGRYSFELRAPERLDRGTGCILKSRGEQRVVVEHADDMRVTIVAPTPVDLSVACALLVAPWFLYERLIGALDSVDDAPLALTLFGKQEPRRVAVALQRDHSHLDPSQRSAVELCVSTNLAFVWGPPGTGKTVTLVATIEELLARGERILLASTTNAAIDQVLAKLSTRPWFAPGVFVRLGRSLAPTFGTELADLVEAAKGQRREALSRARARVGAVEQELRYARALREELVPAVTSQQSLFSASPRLRTGALARVFAAADHLASLEPAAQMRVLDERVARLDKVRTLTRARIAAWAATDRETESQLVRDARVILCTLANTYLSPLLVDQRFDVLIAEEAGMATLPALFVAAAKCTGRAIMVGDPRQLAPIVQAKDEVAQRTLGRSIFDVTVPVPESSPQVSMLTVQYRMAPPIGALVSTLFYGDRIVHRATGVDAITARAPFPGQAIAVVDVPSTCQRPAKGSSRINALSAERTAELAHEAVRAGHESIAVITPYAAQAIELRRLLAARRIGDAVECATIHRFQGSERDVVILDLVDAAPLPPSALVGEPNLLNVSISRARGKLVIVADLAYFAKTDGLVARLLNRARDSR